MFDLPAYLARIALPAAPAPDVAGLAQLHRAHRLAIPFENLDVLLGRGIPLAPAAIFDKLVIRARGGWCFEHNALFLAALHAIGFDARPLLARVWLGQVETPPQTHTLNLVAVHGQAWIADAGFGGSYTPPLPLVEGAEATTPDGARHRLRRDDVHGWMLERDGHLGLTDGRASGEGWQRQYSFTDARVWPADLAMANHYTATVPGGRFSTVALVSIPLPDGFARLTDRHHSHRARDDAIAEEVANADAYRRLLAQTFGIHLTAEEVAALGLFAG